MTKYFEFQLCTYDVWGNPRDGYFVNAVIKDRKFKIKPRWNSAINDYEITNLQINRALGVRGLKWEGDIDGILYASNKAGKPICELRRIK